ncbi:hypothetical protein K437DRAFT_227347 [Tilletiaria anomala UBC 951]|uniref:Amino acid permease/ SLC12A domain-containing protein n=1 Tax=Tilletiaria anomala (strain ATCC 24038 / CBS 436.72 / UBC 951) TaxID=1037660 RepID=A0A066VPE5_TILAU|nr:uncharacterized protein K437DRAFT_227347 [Tilletiaria anomala UBC 951]KDN40435.1 hypothetical protein K437DRAFT_227347 [Tilletiaria anomala UBC 951]
MPRPAGSDRKRTKGVAFDEEALSGTEDFRRGHGRNQRLGHVTRSNSGFAGLEQQLAEGGLGTPHTTIPKQRVPGMISPAEVAPRKLGTWDGVFIPVSLNILGIILFLRFGFILGQVGLLGALLLLFLSYAIDTFTAMSLNAISTNGQVRGGGAYYLISRSLGPEFGGSIGLIFFAGQALNAAMNVLGFVESLTDAYGEKSSEGGLLPEGPCWLFFYGSIVLLLSTIVCLVGSKLFARATLALAAVLAISILSIPVSSIFVHPFSDEDRGAYFTGWSLHTFRENLFPHFTSGAAGSSTGDQVETWQSVFGVLFPAVTGILAGASMSGDLRKPSKSIPKGTNWSLIFTFGIYIGAFFIFAGTVARESFYLDVGIVSDIALSPQLITFGELASTAFSALMGVMACAKVLQAIGRDDLLPVLDVMAQGTEISDTPTFAILFTYGLCQIILLVDSVNVLAQLVTMTTLLTFGTLSFATAALKAGGAPSFRPSFRYWNIWTALAGTASCFGAMFFTDSAAAAACIVCAIFLFTAIHVCSPPKPWGDVTRNLHYYIVRKYLLRIDERKGHVKYWRPQVLLLANNPRTEWNLIIFCNSLKKGALYVLGHVLKGEFAECLPELKKQNIAWLKLVDVTGIKSFVDVIIAPDERQGARNLILSCGLGGMRPNIVVMGFPTHMQFPARLDVSSKSKDTDESHLTVPDVLSSMEANAPHQTINVHVLPTDSARRETPIRPTTYVGIMEDTLSLSKGLAIAYNFANLSIPDPRQKSGENDQSLRYVDLWPVQIASSDMDPSHAWDTYTMVLQLGTILSLTSTWKYHKVRVSVFVEVPEDVEEERRRVHSLLDNLRIPATLRVFCLRTSHLETYDAVVMGRQPVSERVEFALKGDPWWETLKELRREDERRAKAAKRMSKTAPQPIGTASPAMEASPSGTKRRSKREQKILGVSMPPEHLAYFKRNIKIGLAHPKARPRRDDESDADDSDESDDSDLSDELAQLVDDEWFGAGSSGPGLGLRRAATFNTGQRRTGRKTRSYSVGGSHGLPDEPVRRPLLDSPSLRQNGAEYGSMSVTPTPARLGLIPGSMGSTSSGSTLKSTRPVGSRTASPDPYLAPSGSSSVASSRRSSFSAITEPEEGTLRPRDRAAFVRSLGAESQAAADDNQGFLSDMLARDGRRSSRPILHHSRSSMASIKTPKPPLIAFNELPNKAQYLILNELIRNNSSSSTSVVLTALPAPDPGTADDEQKSFRYLKSLHTLFSGGPPVLGVHAKTLTMTMSL